MKAHASGMDLIQGIEAWQLGTGRALRRADFTVSKLSKADFMLVTGLTCALKLASHIYELDHGDQGEVEDTTT
jgi:hypothetical protein